MTSRTLFVVLGLACLVGMTSAMSSPSYGLDWTTLSGGGGRSGSASFDLTGSAVPVPLSSASANYRIDGGFWPGISVAGNPVPTLTGISPTWRSAGGPAFTLVVTGTNFVQGSIVRWNNANRPTTFLSATKLKAAILPADIGSPGYRAVRVYNSAPGGGVSADLPFTVKKVPVITAISPASKPSGSPAFTLTVTGKDFVGMAKVQFAGANLRTKFVSTGKLTATVPKAKLAKKGTRNVKVLNPGAFGGLSNGKVFTIT
jgi:hypothetical protein